jgi:hypothetical protein
MALFSTRIAFPVLVAFVSAVFGAQYGLAQTDPLVGVWKMNAAKSRSSMPLPTEHYRIIQAVGQGLVQVQAYDGDKGMAVVLQTIVCDGKQHPTVGTAGGNTTNTCKRPDQYTRQFTNSKDGRETGGGTMTVSRDGRTMTVTFPNGDALVLDKQ